MELKAPKNQYNKFGKFYYRNAEDILEAVKPLCQTHGAVLIVTDSLVETGGRFYIRATARLYDLDSDGSASADGYAREADEKAGMDASQITGSASSYARKYALNGLFCIDDVKDADSDKPVTASKEDTTESWQKRDGKTYILSENGKWYELGNLSKKQLQDALKSDKFKGCRYEIQKAIKEIRADG